MTQVPKDESEDPISRERRQFADNLIRLRQERGWRQEDLANASGVGQPHISRLEKGTWEPRLATIMALAKALGVQPGDLLPSLNGSKQ